MKIFDYVLLVIIYGIGLMSLLYMIIRFDDNLFIAFLSLIVTIFFHFWRIGCERRI